jgi:2-polyprenyl-3-methyl-5-hydroxy-6-metoxy-1,4-benzoquinol methylase
MCNTSNGYEAIAHRYMSARQRSRVGAQVVRAWARRLPQGANVLDVGCGDGVPVTEVLNESGFEVYGVDASATMIASFRNRFPNAHVECSTVEDSTFFGKSFNGIVAWGLLFLLARNAQECLLAKIAASLITGGQFLFTAPSQACSWLDAMTGQESLSLGREEYQRVLQNVGLTLIEEQQDEGDNHYYLVSKL